MRLLFIVFLLSFQCLKAQEALKITLLQKDSIYFLQAKDRGEISIEFNVLITNLSNVPIYILAPKSYHLKNNNPWEIVIDKQSYKLPASSWCGPEFTIEDIICLQASQTIVQELIWNGFTPDCVAEPGIYKLKLNYNYSKDLNYSDQLDELNVQSDNEISITVKCKNPFYKRKLRKNNVYF